MTISPTRTEDLAGAVALLYGPNAASVDVAHAFRLVARGELKLDDLLVARTNEVLTGAVFCQRLPGALAVIWPPRAAGNDPDTESELIRAAMEHVAGVRVIQSFLPPEESRRADSLLRAGFRHVTSVLQMQHTPIPVPESRLPDARFAPGVEQPCKPKVEFFPYKAADSAVFERTLFQAHDESLDCPELQGVRTPEELIAGYHDCAPDLDRWWLASEGDEPVGVLILGPKELSFVGVVPARRGQGIGRSLVSAAVARDSDLGLIVDVRNEPAIHLYETLGFKVVGVRDVYLLVR